MFGDNRFYTKSIIQPNRSLLTSISFRFRCVPMLSRSGPCLAVRSAFFISPFYLTHSLLCNIVSCDFDPIIFCCTVVCLDAFFFVNSKLGILQSNQSHSIITVILASTNLNFDCMVICCIFLIAVPFPFGGGCPCCVHPKWVSLTLLRFVLLVLQRPGLPISFTTFRFTC